MGNGFELQILKWISTSADAVCNWHSESSPFAFKSTLSATHAMQLVPHGIPFWVRYFATPVDLTNIIPIGDFLLFHPNQNFRQGLVWPPSLSLVFFPLLHIFKSCFLGRVPNDCYLTSHRQREKSWFASLFFCKILLSMPIQKKLRILYHSVKYFSHATNKNQKVGSSQ